MYFFKRYDREHWQEYCHLYNEYEKTIKDTLPNNIQPLMKSYHDNWIEYITYHYDKRLEIYCHGNHIFYGVTNFSIPYKPNFKNTWIFSDINFSGIHVNELVVLENPRRYAWSLMYNLGGRDNSFSEISIEFQDVKIKDFSAKRSSNPLISNRQHKEEVRKILEKKKK